MKFKSKIDSIAYVYNMFFVITIIYIISKSFFKKDIITIFIMSISLTIYEFSFWGKKYFIEDSFIKIFSGIKSKKLYYTNIIRYEIKESRFFINSSIYSSSKYGIEIIYNDNGNEEIIFISPLEKNIFMKVLSSHK